MKTKDVKIGKAYGQAKDDKTPLHETKHVRVKRVQGEVATVVEVLDDEGHIGEDHEVRCRELRALWCVVVEAIEDHEIENADAIAHKAATEAVTLDALGVLREAGFAVEIVDGVLVFEVPDNLS